MRNVEHLCIGNLVMLKRERKVVRVEAITKRKVGYHHNLNKPTHLSYARLDEVEPVMLTQPLVDLTLAFNNLVTLIVFNPDCKSFHFVLSESNYGFKCDYLHEVQNVFNVLHFPPLRTDKVYIDEINKRL